MRILFLGPRRSGWPAIFKLLKNSTFDLDAFYRHYRGRPGLFYSTQERANARVGRTLMKSRLRGILIGSLGAAALSVLPLAVFAGELRFNHEKIQVVHALVAGTDSANINITFTNVDEAGCNGGGDDAIASGIELALSPGSCQSIFATSLANSVVYAIQPFVFGLPFDYVIDPFVSHTIDNEEYGTFFGLNPVGLGPGTVSARIVRLSIPEDGCGTWNLNVQATGLDLSTITSNPISLGLSDADGGNFCLNITDAIIGMKIPPAPKVHRGSRHAS
jgi:hypothetical protein